MNLLQKIFISLGSNQGNRLDNLQMAIDQIHQTTGNLVSISKIYETDAWGFESEKFLNCCIEITTNLAPNTLLKALQNIETTLGRQQKRTDAYEARPIDLDILFYGIQTINEEKLQIPHLELANRNFVLQPLKDIAPDFKHPKFNKTVSVLAANCTDNGNIKPIKKALHFPVNPNDYSIVKRILNSFFQFINRF